MHTATSERQRRMALLAGGSLLTMALVAGFGYGYAFNQLYAATDASATLRNLNRSVYLLRGVIASFLTIMMLDVVVAWAFYLFLEPVNAALSLLTAWFRIVYAAFLAVALSHLLSGLQLLTDVSQNASLVRNSLNAFQDVWSLGLVVFGVHLLLLGYLAWQWAYVPKWIGGLTFFAGACYFGTHLANLVVPGYESYKATIDIILSLPMALGELVLAVWLLVKGRKL